MGGLVSAPFRMLFSFLLGIALFLALWETALFNVSARPTAVGLLTEAGVGIINPALTHSALGTYGLSESGFAAHPDGCRRASERSRDDSWPQRRGAWQRDRGQELRRRHAGRVWQSRREVLRWRRGSGVLRAERIAAGAWDCSRSSPSWAAHPRR